jgi:hypothetical protein
VDSITSNLAALVLVLAGLCLVFMLVLQAMQISRLRQRLDMLTRGSDGESLEAVMGEHLETVHQVGRDLDELTARTAVLESSARHHFARLGLVRFNPFPDTGGNQSFALALLDESEGGFVVSSLHSRTGTRIYAKSVVGGRADTSLSTEETEALDQARSSRPAQPAPATPRGVRGKNAEASVAAAPAVTRAAAAPMPAAAPTAAPAPTPAPAPAAVKAAPAPAPAAVKTELSAEPAAPTAEPAATPKAEPVGAPANAPKVEPAHSSDRRSPGSAAADRTAPAKGQSKSAVVAALDATSASGDAERTGRRSARAVVEAVSGEPRDTPDA